MSNSPLRAKPAFLASVTTASEAYEAFAAGADVIDCKDPSSGALGRLDLGEMANIVQAVGALAVVSATIGDTFRSVDEAVQAARRVAATGVAIVKCGFFGESNDPEIVSALGTADLGAAHRFAVLMADRTQDFALVPHLAQAGFIGVMLDTADKTRGSLRQIMERDRINAFLDVARSHKLATGLAGSLRDVDIGPLVGLGPDLLGFRGALCAKGREGALEGARVQRVRHAIDTAAHANQQQRSVA